MWTTPIMHLQRNKNNKVIYYNSVRVTVLLARFDFDFKKVHESGLLFCIQFKNARWAKDLSLYSVFTSVQELHVVTFLGRNKTKNSENSVRMH